jgi:biotin carboxyl carrier protein
MKLRITVEGRIYDVEVEHIDQAQPLTGRPAAPAAPTAPAPAPAPQTRSPESAPRLSTSVTPQPGPSAGVDHPVDATQAPPSLPPAVPGPHDVSIHLAARIQDVHVKVGDAVRVGDAILDLEVTMANHGKLPFAGTMHTRFAGVITDVLVRPGDTVGPNQPLVRING